ncbi:MAG TPA: pantoate--beta-alanine ligase, partial [Saprospiraceae bacterium]|nr:pantoate--beta-alanine ligase [Saprospiraceae bacterium]
MKTFQTVAELQNHLDQLKSQGKSIGFVPTMGALHSGHISLVKACQRYCDITVVSIFVNPTQFNNSHDLETYPRIPKEDAELLAQNGVDVLFLPSEQEIYPKDLETVVNLDLGNLETVMEGEFRPGHFQGVMQVVKRLLDIVRPDQLFMGQKDFQQFTIIHFMIEKLQLPVKLRVVKTKREEDGLAMSSRNRRLTPENRKIAPEIYKCLKYAKRNLKQKSIHELENYCIERLRKKGFEPEYFTIF